MSDYRKQREKAIRLVSLDFHSLNYFKKQTGSIKKKKLTGTIAR